MSKIQHIRLQKASQNRRHEGLREEEIAFLCGMSDPVVKGKGKRPAAQGLDSEQEEGVNDDPLQD